MIPRITNTLSLLLVILLFIACKTDPVPSETIVETVAVEFKIDSTSVQEKLALKTFNFQLENEEDRLNLPFNYSLENNSGHYLFLWQLCDLTINSDSSNYHHYGFENNFPYKGYCGFEGRIHFIATTDSLAVSTEKFLNNQSEAYDKIYYSDDECVLFKSGIDKVYALYFTYLSDKQCFAVFFKENSPLGFEATEEELVDLSITQIRLAKNLFTVENQDDLQNWTYFKNALSMLDQRMFRNIYSSMKSSIDSLQKDLIYTPKIDGNYKLISAILVGEKSDSLWTAINSIPKHSGINFSTIYKNEFSDQIAFFRSSGSKFQLEYQNENSVIIKKVYESGYANYFAICKRMIADKEVGIFTGGFQNSGQVYNKEMSYFYLHLFENFERI